MNSLIKADNFLVDLERDEMEANLGSFEVGEDADDELLFGYRN